MHFFCYEINFIAFKRRSKGPDQGISNPENLACDKKVNPALILYLYRTNTCQINRNGSDLTPKS